MTKIAIIEDEQAISQMYRFKFEAEGYTVETADNGKTGLELIKTFQPVLILLDLMMPEMTGDKMLEKLRTYDWAKDIKVIILTNITADVAPPNLRNLNVDGYIIKAQYTPQQVVDLSKRVLESKL